MTWYQIALDDHAGVPSAVGTVDSTTHINPTTGEKEYTGYVVGILDKNFTREHTYQDPETSESTTSGSAELKKFPIVPQAEIGGQNCSQKRVISTFKKGLQTFKAQAFTIPELQICKS